MRLLHQQKNWPHLGQILFGCHTFRRIGEWWTTQPRKTHESPTRPFERLLGVLFHSHKRFPHGLVWLEEIWMSKDLWWPNMSACSSRFLALKSAGKKNTSFKLGGIFVEREVIHSMQHSYNIVTVWPCQTKCAEHGGCHNQLKFHPQKLEKPCITKGLATCQSLGARFSHEAKSLWWIPKQPGASTNHPILLLERLEPWPWPPWPWLRLRRRPWHTTNWGHLVEGLMIFLLKLLY